MLNKQIFAALTTALMLLSLSPIPAVFAADTLAATPVDSADEDAQIPCTDPGCDVDESIFVPPEESTTPTPAVEPTKPETPPQPEIQPEAQPKVQPETKPEQPKVTTEFKRPSPPFIQTKPAATELTPDITTELGGGGMQIPSVETTVVTPSAPPIVVSSAPVAAAVIPNPVDTSLIQASAQSGLNLVPGKSAAEVKATDEKIKNDATQKVQELLKKGTISEDEVKKTEKQIIRIERAFVRVAAIDDAAKQAGIDTSKKGLTSDDRLYQVNMMYNLPPKAPAKEVVAKIYGASSAADLGKTTTVSIHNNDALSSEGFTVLAGVVTSNSPYTLYLRGRNNDETPLATVISSPNDANKPKAVFAIDNIQIPNDGKYTIIVRKGAPPAKTTGFFSANTAYAAAQSDASKPVTVNMLKDTEVPSPVVKSLGGLPVTDTSNLKVVQSADGKVHISGTADVSTMVVGTFESAVFTSAMLADVDTGNFDIVSSEALLPGEHEVVIYATRPEEAAQSKPVKLRFSIISTAQAAAVETTPPQSVTTPAPVSPLSNIPVMPIAGVVAVALVITVVGVLARKKKTPKTNSKTNPKV